jgi:2-keto-4-pentenoate hydratase
VRAACAALLALAAPAPAAACAVDVARADALAAAWLARQPLRGVPAGMDAAEAACWRAALVARLQPALGRIAGYKAALTNAAVQRRFGASSPVRGVLLEGMLWLASALPVEAGYGARPVFEADLLFEVGDEAINEARTPLEALRGLARLYPFIELADLALAEGEALDAGAIAAVNAGARAGVFGAPLAVEPTQAFADALRDMRVVTTDENDRELAAAPGAAVLGHPLNAVLWLIEDLRRDGIRLRPGDRLSVGAFSPPLAPRPGLRPRVRYIGLPGDPEVSLRFK